MKTHRREILIYFNPDSSNDRKTVAHAQGLVPHVRTYSFEQAPSTCTSWQQILSSLQMHPKQLMNKSHPYYQAHIRGREFNNEDWLNVIKYNPALIKAPIAIRQGKAILCVSATDIYKLTNPEPAELV
ncbi:MAG: glutaredoxin [Saprospiraceae bacterium]|nr:MAG: glutaredoxin [Saprospiraceae bacterium]